MQAKQAYICEYMIHDNREALLSLWNVSGSPPFSGCAVNTWACRAPLDTSPPHHAVARSSMSNRAASLMLSPGPARGIVFGSGHLHNMCAWPCFTSPRPLVRWLSGSPPGGHSSPGQAELRGSGNNLRVPSRTLNRLQIPHERLSQNCVFFAPLDCHHRLSLSF